MLSQALERHPGTLALSTSLGPSSIVILDLLDRLQARVPVFLLDTGLLFPETYALKVRVAHRFGVTIRSVRPALSLADQAATHGPALWRRDPDRCCALRKVAPLARALEGQTAWLTGLRRDQGPTRRDLRHVQVDPEGGLERIAPLAAWTEAQVRAWLRAHDLPHNPLLDEGYRSVGCWPCTHPSAAGGDERSGRWAGREKTECGIHHLYTQTEGA